MVDAMVGAMVDAMADVLVEEPSTVIDEWFGSKVQPQYLQ